MTYHAQLHGTIQVKVLPHGKDVPLPSYATNMSVGMDLYAAIPSPQGIKPGDRVVIPTGLSMAIPLWTVGYVHAKSGRARVEGLVLPHGTGVLDPDYRGELLVLVTNISPYNTITINPGEKIAQLVVVPYVRCQLEPVEELSPTKRGEGGFGSTGVK